MLTKNKRTINMPTQSLFAPSDSSFESLTSILSTAFDPTLAAYPKWTSRYCVQLLERKATIVFGSIWLAQSIQEAMPWPKQSSHSGPCKLRLVILVKTDQSIACRFVYNTLHWLRACSAVGLTYGSFKGNMREATFHELVRSYSWHYNQIDCRELVLCEFLKRFEAYVGLARSSPQCIDVSQPSPKQPKPHCGSCEAHIVTFLYCSDECLSLSISAAIICSNCSSWLCIRFPRLGEPTGAPKTTKWKGPHDLVWSYLCHYDQIEGCYDLSSYRVSEGCASSEQNGHSDAKPMHSISRTGSSQRI